MQKKICYSCFRELMDESNICPHCGYQNGKNKADYPFALPEGTVLNGCYIVGRVLGQGGFGITYIAQDYKTKALVAIKEYYPDTMAARLDAYTVSAYSGQRAESFQYGKECFLEEAKTLAEFIGNPNIVRVHCYFEENSTAYFVMDYVEGESFQKYLKNRGGKISWEETKQILFPVMDALTAVHAKGIIHRDVSPDNIFITNDGSVKLLDFGAARYSLGDKSRSLDVVLKHGFAPKEQYTRHGRQGPYTDVYSLAATMYYAITFRLPPDSIDRFEEDDLIMPSSLGVVIPPEEEDVVLKALSVRASDRYQNMAEFKQALIQAAEKDDVTEDVVQEDDIQEEQVTENVVQEDTQVKDTIVDHNNLKILSGKGKWFISAAGIGVVILALAFAGIGISGNNSSNSTSESAGKIQNEEEKGTGTSNTADAKDNIGKIDTIEMQSSTDKKTELVSLEVKDVYYNDDGSLNYYYTYELDDNGNKVKETSFSDDDSLRHWSEYQYDEDGNKIQWTEFDGDGKLSFLFQYEYDEKGNRIKEIKINEDGIREKWEEYEYDEKGNKIKNTEYDGDGSISDWMEYEYDNAGNEIQWTLFSEDGNVRVCNKYEYDGDGNEIREKHFDGDGNVEAWYESEYDEDGNKIKWTNRNSDGSIDYWCEYECDSEGTLLSEVKYLGDGSIEETTEWTYDKYENLVKWERFDSDGNTVELSEYEYSYDANGNMLKETWYKNGKLNNIVEYIVMEVPVRKDK